MKRKLWTRWSRRSRRAVGLNLCIRGKIIIVAIRAENSNRRIREMMIHIKAEV